jgi:uridine phosphorylase
VGSTGVLQSHIERGSIIIPNEAIRDEGTSYHYLPPFRKAKPSNVLTQKLKKSCLKYGIIPYEGKTWTTDAFFRETYEKRDYFRKNGAICVEMEASGAFAVAEYRKIKLAALLIASDSIANNKWNNRKSKEEIKKYKETQKKMFQIVMDTLCQK